MEQTTPEFIIIVAALLGGDLQETGSIFISTRQRFFETPNKENFDAMLNLIGISEAARAGLNPDLYDGNKALFTQVKGMFETSLLTGYTEYPDGGCFRHLQVLNFVAANLA